MKENSTPFDVAEYDRQIKRTLPFYEEMFQQVVNIVRILNLQSLRWLDVGCGTGKMARTVLDNFDIQKMVCIDVEQEMLERAESLRDDEKVEFLQCDVRELHTNPDYRRLGIAVKTLELLVADAKEKVCNL